MNCAQCETFVNYILVESVTDTMSIPLFEEETCLKKKSLVLGWRGLFSTGGVFTFTTECKDCTTSYFLNTLKEYNQPPSQKENLFFAILSCWTLFNIPFLYSGFKRLEYVWTRSRGWFLDGRQVLRVLLAVKINYQPPVHSYDQYWSLPWKTVDHTWSTLIGVSYRDHYGRNGVQNILLPPIGGRHRLLCFMTIPKWQIWNHSRKIC